MGRSKSSSGIRNPDLEGGLGDVFWTEPRPAVCDLDKRHHPMLHRELKHRGITAHRGGHAVELIACVEVG